ncbi:MAG TPA: Ger(x)C family spore germination protein [Bacillus sp. (in: firmicutes)]|nr:Ger(x)C family spore germination protein [Bacillus sp. (in: firmicutes)]
MKLKVGIIIIIGCVVYLYGRQPKQIVDDIEMPAVVGYDYVDKDTFKTTFTIPVYKPDKSVDNRTVSAEGKMSKEAVGKIDRKTSRRAVGGKLEVAVYSKRIAQNGIGGLIDTFHRDPTISEKLFLTVVDGQAKTLLDKQYSDEDTGVFLSRLIEHNIEHGLLPTMNLHYFLSAYFSKMRDPFLPLLEKKGNGVNLKGIALFKEDRYVKALPESQLFAFKMLIENMTLGSYKVRLNKDEYVLIQSIHAKHKYKVHHEKEGPKIDIHLALKGSIREFTGEKLEQKEMTEVEKQMKKQLEKQIAAMIQSFQKSKIDPIGLGNEVRSRTRNFNREKWLDQYPNVKVNVKVKVLISERGVANGT